MVNYTLHFHNIKFMWQSEIEKKSVENNVFEYVCIISY